MKKISDLSLTVFAVGILVCLFAGGLSAVFYVVALFIGGDAATGLCAWTFKTYLPWVIRATSVFSGIGLIGMYLTNQKALTVTNEDAIAEQSEGK